MRFLFDRRYPNVLLFLFLIVAAIAAIRPKYLNAWMLENALTLFFVVALILTHRRFPFSNISYTLIFVFMCLHTLGSHYTYSEVPYNEWTQKLVGSSLNSWFGFQRNHYDRLVHFAFGLLLAYPIRELFMRVAAARGFWSYYLPLDLTMSFSMVYELIEWAAAIILGGDLGQAYLGSQGDQWDAHKDMALATLGATISMAVVAFINWKFDKHFAAEMRDSFTAKKGPLGEEKLRQLLAEANR